jgi:hypothetical protein
VNASMPGWIRLIQAAQRIVPHTPIAIANKTVVPRQAIDRAEPVFLKIRR